MKYSYFDYKKVVCILNQLNFQVQSFDEKKSGYYQVHVSSMEFDGILYNTLDVLDFLSVEKFCDVGVFNTVAASMSLKNDRASLFLFQMGEEKCQIISIDTLSDEDKEIFKDVLPFEFPANESWQLVLSEFIKKVSLIAIDEKLRMV